MCVRCVEFWSAAAEAASCVLVFCSPWRGKGGGDSAGYNVSVFQRGDKRMPRTALSLRKNHRFGVVAAFSLVFLMVSGARARCWWC